MCGWDKQGQSIPSNGALKDTCIDGGEVNNDCVNLHTAATAHPIAARSSSLGGSLQVKLQPTRSPWSRYVALGTCEFDTPGLIYFMATRTDPFCSLLGIQTPAKLPLNLVQTPVSVRMRLHIAISSC